MIIVLYIIVGLLGVLLAKTLQSKVELAKKTEELQSKINDATVEIQKAKTMVDGAFNTFNFVLQAIPASLVKKVNSNLKKEGIEIVRVKNEEGKMVNVLDQIPVDAEPKKKEKKSKAKN